MDFLAISGSARRLSTNTALLRAVSEIARPDHAIGVFDRIGDLPVFSPLPEARPLPDVVQEFIARLRHSDGLILASPEYVRSIPGGLKNAPDWLVSRDALVDKPIALMHASHRGDDMLAQLRIVLSTVSTRFSGDLFLRFEVVNKLPEEIAEHLGLPSNRTNVVDFVQRFAACCG